MHGGNIEKPEKVASFFLKALTKECFLRVLSCACSWTLGAPINAGKA
jgi:hypothetical protein